MVIIESMTGFMAPDGLINLQSRLKFGVLEFINKKVDLWGGSINEQDRMFPRRIYFVVTILNWDELLRFERLCYSASFLNKGRSENNQWKMFITSCGVQFKTFLVTRTTKVGIENTKGSYSTTCQLSGIGCTPYLVCDNIVIL
jgi:hypothetical protein